MFDWVNVDKILLNAIALLSFSYFSLYSNDSAWFKLISYSFNWILNSLISIAYLFNSFLHSANSILRLLFSSVISTIYYYTYFSIEKLVIASLRITCIYEVCILLLTLSLELNESIWLFILITFLFILRVLFFLIIGYYSF